MQARAEGEAKAKLEARSLAAQAERERAEKERLAAEKLELERKLATAKLEAEATKRASASGQEKARQEAEGRSAQERARLEKERSEREKLELEKAELEVALARAKTKRQADEAAANAGKREVAVARPESQASPAASVQLTYVGFKQDRGVGRVVVRTSAPAAYALGEDRDRNVVLTLARADLALPGGERLLDTSFFDTAVARILPGTRGGDAQIVVQLKQPVSYRVSQQGSELTLEFARP